MRPCCDPSEWFGPFGLLIQETLPQQGEEESNGQAGGGEPRAHLSKAARRATRNPGAVTLARDFK